MGRVKKTDERFKEEVRNKFKGRYIVEGEYKGNDSRVKMVCINCHTPQETTAGYVLSKYRNYSCRECKRVAKENKYIKQVKEDVGDEYVVLGRYETQESKIEMRHQKCGHEWGILPYSFLNMGTRCPKCSIMKRSQYNKEDIEYFREVFIHNMGEDYTLQSDYKGKSFKIKIKHKKCGYEDETLARNITDSKYSCPFCTFRRGLKLDTDLYKKRVKIRREDYKDYKLLSEYKDAKTKVWIKHLICGKEFPILPSNFYTTSCPHCFGTHLKTQEQFESELGELLGDEYEVIGKYLHNAHKIEIKHTTCGRIYPVRPYSILSGHGCRSCSSSKGEKYIKQYLDTYNIYYKGEYTFEDLYYRKRENKLRYDFGIFDRDGKLDKLIEFDGLQHERPVELFGGYEAYIDLVKRDGIKNKYALDNGYELYRVPYGELENINKVMEEIIYNKSRRFLVTR